MEEVYETNIEEQKMLTRTGKALYNIFESSAVIASARYK